MKLINKNLILICFFFAVGLVIITPTINGIEQEKTTSTIADKDTYIDTDNPLSNYGGVNNLRCGFSYSYEIREAYFHFSFPDKPENVTKAELSLDIWGVSQTMDLTLSIINESWGELTMDWMSRPAHGQTIGPLVAASSDIYKIDITSLLTTRTEISICVNMTFDDVVDDYVFITSREGYFLTSDAPQIIWTYLETVPAAPDVPDGVIPSYNVFIIIGIIGIIGFFLKKKIEIKKF